MAAETKGMVDAFLEDVDEQISCKIGLDEVNRELRDHIEDKAELYRQYGLEEEEACRRAVRDMGAADVVGMELNRHHRLRTAKPLLTLMLVLMAVSLAGNVLKIGTEGNWYTAACQIRENAQYILALAALLWVTRFGYPFLLKHTKKVCLVFLLACAVLGIVNGETVRHLDWFDRMYLAGGAVGILGNLLRLLRRHTLFFGIVQLAAPVGAVLLYRTRHRGMAAVFWLFCFQAAGTVLAGTYLMGERDFIPNLLLYLNCLGVTLYFLAKGWIDVPKKKGTAASLASFCVLLALWAAPQWGQIKECIQICVDPGSHASVTDAWEDSYNNVLIRELLGRAQVFGEVELTEEEMIRYGTSQWYYEDGEGNWNSGEVPSLSFLSLEEHVKYRMQHLEEPDLRNILPQYYMENYRITWWILRYGLAPALLLTALVLTLPALAFFTVFRIRNRMGRAVAFSAALSFALQTVIYFFENFGFQFGGFSNLPFVSEGLVSFVGSAVLAGLLLSAYRYDVVLREPREDTDHFFRLRYTSR